MARLVYYEWPYNDRLEKSYPNDPRHAYAEPNYLMRNVDGRQYVDISEAVGIRKLPNRVGRGTAFGDFDNDGDIDLLIVNKNDIPLLLRNDGGNAKNWIVLRTEGTKSNRSGIGARVSMNAEFSAVSLRSEEVIAIFPATISVCTSG